MIAKSNAGAVWTASNTDENGNRTQRQMREGTPENVTHLVWDGNASFWVQGDLADIQTEFPGCVIEPVK